MKSWDIIDENEYNYLMDGSGIESPNGMGISGCLKPIMVERLLPSTLNRWILRPFEEDCAKPIKPIEKVGKDGVVTLKRPSLASLRKNSKRLKVIEALFGRRNDNKPEWMMLKRIPVMPLIYVHWFLWKVVDLQHRT